MLLDDTPLAFLRQPDNGIPVLTFRSAARPPSFNPSMLCLSSPSSLKEPKHILGCSTALPKLSISSFYAPDETGCDHPLQQVA